MTGARTTIRARLFRPAALLCAWAIAVGGGGAPAAAQLAPGHSGSAGVQYLGQEEAWWALRNLGDCLAQNRARLAEAFVATYPNTMQEAAASRALLGNNTSCLRHATRMAVARDILRGVVAEGLYARHIGAPPAALAEAPQYRQPVARDGTPLPLPVLVTFARCYAAIRPGEVHRLLTTTRLGTRGEHAAIEAMASEFGGCVPAGARINFQAPVVRTVLAEALYHRARAAAPRQQRGR